MTNSIKPMTLLGNLETDHAGVKLVVHADAFDHVSMRTKQLAALLRLVSGTGANTFLSADLDTQDGVLWLASSLADDVERMMPLVESEMARPGLSATQGPEAAP